MDQVPPDDKDDYWPCACVRRDRGGNMSHIKLHHRTVRHCRVCRCDRPDMVVFGKLDFAEMAIRLQDWLDDIYGSGVASVGVGEFELFIYQHRRVLMRQFPEWVMEIGCDVTWKYVGKVKPLQST